MIEINAAYSWIEVTGNFIAGDNLSPGHEESLGDLLKNADTAGKKKGSIYVSPIKRQP